MPKPSHRAILSTPAEPPAPPSLVTVRVAASSPIFEEGAVRHPGATYQTPPERAAALGPLVAIDPAR